MKGDFDREIETAVAETVACRHHDLAFLRCSKAFEGALEELWTVVAPHDPFESHFIYRPRRWLLIATGGPQNDTISLLPLLLPLSNAALTIKSYRALIFLSALFYGVRCLIAHGKGEMTLQQSILRASVTRMTTMDLDGLNGPKWINFFDRQVDLAHAFRGQYHPPRKMVEAAKRFYQAVIHHLAHCLGDQQATTFPKEFELVYRPGLINDPAPLPETGLAHAQRCHCVHRRNINSTLPLLLTPDPKEIRAPEAGPEYQVHGEYFILPVENHNIEDRMKSLISSSLSRHMNIRRAACLLASRRNIILAFSMGNGVTLQGHAPLDRSAIRVLSEQRFSSRENLLRLVLYKSENFPNFAMNANLRYAVQDGCDICGGCVFLGETENTAIRRLMSNDTFSDRFIDYVLNRLSNPIPVVRYNTPQMQILELDVPDNWNAQH